MLVKEIGLGTIVEVVSVRLIYALFLSHHPIMVMILTSFISITLTSLALFLADIPKFTHPTLGFETHGTDFSRRISTFKIIEQQTSVNEDYTKRFFRRFSSTYLRLKSRNSDNIDNLSRNCSAPKQSCYDSDALESSR
uniref:Uncharacterized protein n=1 Tax=Romanomermis culicivorax TaxID=13658 RepID=A0A915HXP7_ROMCU